MVITMMDLYTAHTPNGHKVSIALEEMNIPYKAYNVHLGKKEIFHERFLPLEQGQMISFF